MFEAKVDLASKGPSPKRRNIRHRSIAKEAYPPLTGLDYEHSIDMRDIESSKRDLQFNTEAEQMLRFKRDSKS